MRDILMMIYLDYKNNYASYELYAKRYELTNREAEALIRLARDVFERYTFSTKGTSCTN